MQQSSRVSRIVVVFIVVILVLDACKKNSMSPGQGAPIRPINANSSPYVSDLFEYNPAPGQFVNTSLANDSTARTILKNANGLLSLGAWGGNVVYGFDHTVIDVEGPDLLTTGNAFIQLAEPGVVWVMQDVNGNGLPDDLWYELAGSETGKPGYVRDYTVAYYRPSPANGNVKWKDTQGDSGFVRTNIFHSQDYYPDNLVADSYTLTGTKLPSTNIDATDSAYIISAPFAYGYSDNIAGGDSLDIAAAIDSIGNTVELTGIDFIKIQTGILANMGALGEQSTEIGSIGDLNMLH